MGTVQEESGVYQWKESSSQGLEVRILKTILIKYSKGLALWLSEYGAYCLRWLPGICGKVEGLHRLHKTVLCPDMHTIACMHTLNK